VRTITSAQEEAFLGTSRRLYHRFQIEDPSGAWVDYTTDGGSAIDWVDRWTISATVDQPIVGLEVELFREVDGESLAPYLSPGAEAIKPGRGVRVYVAATALGAATPSFPGDYFLLFDGFVDGWVAGERRETISLSCRDRLGLLADTWSVAANEYGSTAGTDIRTVTQAIVSERLSESLEWVGDPDFGIVTYEQSREAMLDAVLANVDLIGWLVRYRWSDVYDAFRIEIFEPARSSPALDWTVSPSDYYELPLFAEDTDEIRNEGIILWSGGTVTATDDDSIAEYGRTKTIVLDARQDIQITTEARATNLITAVVADLSQPLVQASAILPLAPWVMVGDFYRFEPNGALHAASQDMAVVSWEHTYGPDGAETRLELRGQPSGGVTRWDAVRDRLEREAVPEEETPPAAVAEGDIEFYYTVASGSGGQTTPGSADGSLGGWISSVDRAERRRLFGSRLNHLLAPGRRRRYRERRGDRTSPPDGGVAALRSSRIHDRRPARGDRPSTDLFPVTHAAMRYSFLGLAMTVALALPLRTTIGALPPSSIFGNDSWVDFRTSGLWDPGWFGGWGDENFDIEERDGYLVVTPLESKTFFVTVTGARVGWGATLADDRELDFTNSAVYWSWHPPTGGNSYLTQVYFADRDADWFSFWQIYQNVGGSPRMYVEMSHFGSASPDFVWTDFAYDPDAHRWARYVHDASSGTVSAQVASSGGTWTTILTLPDAGFPMTRFEWQIYGALYDTVGPPWYEAPETFGWIGPINQVPVPRSLPLSVDIGDVRVSTVAKALPLRVDVGELSPGPSGSP